MQIHKLTIFNSASDNQIYLYQAICCRQNAKDIGQEEAVEQGGNTGKWGSDDEGGDPDSDQSFTLAVLDSQSFMRKITLQIILAAISHNGTELQFSDIALLFRKPLSFRAWPNQVQHQACVVIPSSHYSWMTMHQAPTSTTFSVISWASLSKVDQNWLCSYLHCHCNF